MIFFLQNLTNVRQKTRNVFFFYCDLSNSKVWPFLWNSDRLSRQISASFSLFIQNQHNRGILDSSTVNCQLQNNSFVNFQLQSIRLRLIMSFCDRMWYVCLSQPDIRMWPTVHFNWDSLNWGKVDSFFSNLYFSESAPFSLLFIIIIIIFVMVFFHRYLCKEHWLITSCVQSAVVAHFWGKTPLIFSRCIS